MIEPVTGRRVCCHCGALLPRHSRASGCARCMFQAALGRSPATANEMEPEPATPATPKIPFGDYILEEEIAHGGMGVVYRARHQRLDRTVAIKLLLLGRHASGESIDRFRREARSVA